MTKIPQVNIWVEAEAFDSITDDDIALGIVAATEAAECNTKRSSSPSAVRLRRCPAHILPCPRVGRWVIDERARPWSRRTDKSREALKARSGKPISPAPHSHFPRRIGILSSGDPAAGEAENESGAPAAPELMATHLAMPSRPLIILRTLWDNATLAGAARVPVATLSSPSSCSKGLARKA